MWFWVWLAILKIIPLWIKHPTRGMIQVSVGKLYKDSIMTWIPWERHFLMTYWKHLNIFNPPYIKHCLDINVSTYYMVSRMRLHSNAGILKKIKHSIATETEWLAMRWDPWGGTFQMTQFTYIIEVHYLAVSKYGLYATLLIEHCIQIYLAAKGHLCMMNHAFYPVECLEWCVSALFISNKEYVNKYQIVNSKHRHANLAVRLDGWLWAVNSLATERFKIQCLMETHIQWIIPPLTIISIDNGCERYSSYICILIIWINRLNGHTNPMKFL